MALHDYMFSDQPTQAFPIPDGVWAEGYVRLFISHVHKHREVVTLLKQLLAPYKVDGFVAHRDIKPSAEWRDTIDAALLSCQALVAYLTDDFHDSDWTDQEVGYALAQRRLVIPIRVGAVNPYGLMGKFQALPNQADPIALAREVADTLWRHEPTRAHMTVARVERFANSWSFDDARANWERVREIPAATWTDDMRQRMREAVLENNQVSECNYGPRRATRPLPELIHELLDKTDPG